MYRQKAEIEDAQNSTMNEILKTWELEGYRRVEILPTSEYGKSLPLILHHGTDYDLHSKKLNRSGAASTELYLTKSGLQVLREIKGNVAVVSIVGPARTGKSFITSAILGDLNVFPVGHEINSETRGLWISTIGMQKANGDTVVFIDTEGTDDPSSEDASDVNLSLITLLSSSLYIYNTKATFKRNDCEFLTHVINKALCQTSPLGFSDLGHDRFRPDFLWLIRDMQMNPTVNGRSVTADIFFEEKVLNQWPGGRRTLRNVFKDVCCKEIPLPATDHRFLAEMVQNPWRLSQQFCKTLKHIVEAHVCRIRPKRRSCSNGEFLSGRKLAVYMESLLQDLTTEKEHSPSSLVASGGMWHQEGYKGVSVRNREYGAATNSGRSQYELSQRFCPRLGTENVTRIYPEKISSYNEQLETLKGDIQRNIWQNVHYTESEFRRDVQRLGHLYIFIPGGQEDFEKEKDFLLQQFRSVQSERESASNFIKQNEALERDTLRLKRQTLETEKQLEQDERQFNAVMRGAEADFMEKQLEHRYNHRKQLANIEERFAHALEKNEEIFPKYMQDCVDDDEDDEDYYGRDDYDDDWGVLLDYNLFSGISDGVAVKRSKVCCIL